ncbi:MAG: hypothetical protein R3A13_02210 [Bdellovibrionota bacterium]
MVFEQSITSWETISPASKLRMILGAWSGDDFSIEQLCDLISFPDERIAKKAGDILASKAENFTLGIIANALLSHKLSLPRDQAASLLLALALPEKTSHQYIAKWFTLNPQSEVVVKLLNVVNGKKGSDRLAIEAARYLSRIDWEASRDTIVALSAHSEPLVRAVAYAKLDVNNKQERLILEKRRAMEKDAGLKRRLGEKLDS